MCVVCVCVLCVCCVCVVIVAETRREPQHVLEVLDEACTRGMCISVSKTKIVRVRTGEHQPMDQ